LPADERQTDEASNRAFTSSTADRKKAGTLNLISRVPLLLFLFCYRGREEETLLGARLKKCGDEE